MSLIAILLAGTADIPFLKEIALIPGLSVLVIYIFRKIKLPAIPGFLAARILFAPNALGLHHQ